MALSTNSGRWWCGRAGRRRLRHTTTIILCAAVFVPFASEWSSAAGGNGTPINATLVDVNGHYPVGIPDSSEPSGEAPPGPNALVGYHLSYVADFTGTTVPKGWDAFSGIPGGDPGGQFAASHVVVGDGLLQLNTWRDSQYQYRWVTGGICQCGVARVYGAYFVRSRISGAGPTAVELLWPLTNQWPPEIDFNETGGSATHTSSSLHYGKTNHIIGRRVDIDMTKWHTWGVIWTAKEVIYTVDGRIWGAVKGTYQIPKIRMTIDFEQRQECEENRQCPTAPETMQIDWVAEYVRSGG